MKKLIASALFIFTLSIGMPAYADITMNYVQDGMTTTADHYSLAGQCDPSNPLYVNGEKIPVTKEGYFSYYASLKEGENIFKFDNTSSQKTYTITRTASSTVASDPFKSTDFIGKVNAHSPTVRTRPDEANDDLVLPYVTGTLLHITGENSEYYKTSNGRYIYKSSVDKATENYGNNNIKNLTFAGNKITFDMDRPTEYSITFTDSGLRVVFYDIKGTQLANPDSKTFKSVSYSTIGINNAPTYTFKFAENGKFIGYRAEYNQNNLTLTLNPKTKLSGDSLAGAKVVLDAGHGGDDAGTLGLGNVYEKTVTLAITEQIKNYLESKGAEVVLTRSDDSTVALGDRTARINQELPDVAVSVHCNSRNEWDDFGAEKGMIDFYTFDLSAPLAKSMSLDSNASYEVSNLALTRVSGCPTVLVETGYMSNPEEYAYLVSSSGQKEIALRIGKAVENYLKAQ